MKTYYPREVSVAGNSITFKKWFRKLSFEVQVLGEDIYLPLIYNPEDPDNSSNNRGNAKYSIAIQLIYSIGSRLIFNFECCDEQR